MKDYMETHEHFVHAYGKKYTDKIAHLQRRITELETGENKFVVLPLEAGIGKSVQSDRIVGEYIRDGGTRRFLIVKKFIEDVETSQNRINEIVGSRRALTSPLVRQIPAALGITTKNWRTLRESPSDLQLYQVIIITDQRYMRLCMDENTRLYFTTERHTLVIDEALPIPIATFSEREYRTAQNLLPIALHDELKSICKPLLDELTLQAERQKESVNTILRCRPQIETEKLNDFKGLVDANLDRITDRTRTDEVKQFVSGLFVIYGNLCLYNHGHLSTVEPSVQPWRLKNNIILDANGIIDRYYHYANIYVDRQTPIIDHSKWTLTQTKFNASMQNIRYTKNYIEAICNLIAERQGEGEKTLVVTQKKLEEKFCDKIEEMKMANIAVAHFGNIIGKNDWRDYNQVWIVTTPNLPMETYPLRWAMATGESLAHKNLELDAGKGEDKKGRFGFRNEEFEDMRFHDVVKENYQAIKRINRDNTKAADVFVVTADDRIITHLKQLMKEIKIGEPLELDVEYLPSAPKGGPSQVERLADYLMRLEPGPYRKQEIYSALELDKKNFGRLLKKERILRLEASGEIKISTRTISRLQRT